ncbi:MAG TPA: MFS transporter [Actinomycetaceae bacterium]|nr:MFS transporter [Actinomycetaceae bacterium]
MTEQTATTPDFSGSSGTPGPTGRRGPAALRHRGFRQLAGAWVFTNAADSALYLMLAVWVKELTGSDGAAGAVLATLGLPALIAPFLGQLADRVSRKWLLAVGNLAMALVVLSLVLVGGAEDVWAIYAVTFLYGAMGFLTASAQSGLVRDLLSDDELAGGNGLLTTVDQAFRLVSPLVGTALYVAAGPRAVVVLTAACFTVSAILLTRVEVVETGRPEASGSGYWAELVGGVRHLVATAPLGVLTVTMTLGMAATGFVNVAIFPMMEHGLGVAPSMLGVLVSVQGVGAVLGGLTVARVITRWDEIRAIAIGLAVMVAGMAPFAFIGLIDLPQPVVVGVGGAGLALVGLGVPWAIVGFVTLRQRLTPAHLQGRVAAATNIAFNLPQTLAALAAAALIGLIDYRVLVVLTALCLLVAAALSARVRPITQAPLGQS